ncbi:putative protein phosphatase 2C 58 [Senna tora]|uniref:PPM-type phosphatase domain-containing protein n=1 Tax=Senna tora TaxID=362788 RepID=A0A834W1M4_9FABA|nr:putative protein phosphatase 2C 58 [Senna tora]
MTGRDILQLIKGDFWTETETAVKRAYYMTDQKILEQSLELGRGGSTAVTAILINGDVPRVDGRLAVARAFGDKSLKMHLSSEPDVVVVTVEEDTEFLIMASDGIWKEAVDCIRQKKDAQAAAKRLIEEAVARKSRMTYPA